ncbi:MAG: polyprenol monophosphomannose synthase [Deltaproteobacteria bacterium]|nr:polyprenol monophosphomannose synthase [Deltaproteobacteria bacterium]
MQLTVVVPTYNEVGTLERLTRALLELRLPDVAMRVLIVDDASEDGTAGVADRLAQAAPGAVEVLHRVGRRGLGSAYAAGFARALASEAGLIAQMDADLSHDPQVLRAMHAAIGEADVVIGSRYVAGGSLDPHWGWHRKLLSHLANRVVVPAALTLHVRDATSGFRLWRREALAAIAPSLNARSGGYAFQVEMALLAERAGCRIAEVPIHFRERESGRSKMNGWVALTAARELWSMRRRAGGAARRAQH